MCLVDGLNLFHRDSQFPLKLLKYNTFCSLSDKAALCLYDCVVALSKYDSASVALVNVVNVCTEDPM